MHNGSSDAVDSVLLVVNAGLSASGIDAQRARNVSHTQQTRELAAAQRKNSLATAKP